jgi:hypothetical protein
MFSFGCKGRGPGTGKWFAFANYDKDGKLIAVEWANKSGSVEWNIVPEVRNELYANNAANVVCKLGELGKVRVVCEVRRGGVLRVDLEEHPEVWAEVRMEVVVSKEMHDKIADRYVESDRVKAAGGSYKRHVHRTD